MNRLIGLLLLLLVLGGVAYYVFQNKGGDTNNSLMNTADRQFAIENPDDIYKIKLTQPSGREIVFERSKTGWTVNGKYEASKHVMPYIMTNLTKVDINFIPAKAAVPNLLESMDKTGIHVEVFDRDGDKLRGYRVGPDLTKKSSTAYLMDGAKLPYYVRLKGFEGGLRSRFSQKVDQYRSMKVFGYDEKDIDQITVNYHKKPSASFVLTNGEQIEVKPLSAFVTPIDKPVNQNYAKAYLGTFRELYGEGYKNEDRFRSKIKGLTPFATVAVKDKSGNEKSIDLYSFNEIKLGDKAEEIKGPNEVHQIERFYADASDGDLVVVQLRLFKEVFRSYDFFHAG